MMYWLKTSVIFFIFAGSISAVVVFAGMEYPSEMEFSRHNHVDPSKEAEEYRLSDELVLYPSPPYQLSDIRVFEPRDVQIIEKNGDLLLVFSTIYYNQGDAPLELVADVEEDEADKERKEDRQRVVFQNIYRDDGEVFQKPVGTFVWHGAHNHYHFADFVDFRLEPTQETAKKYKVSIDDISVKEKATFCIRDVSQVSLEIDLAPKDAVYRTCDEKKQGVSVGWGDTYFFDYPDQDIDITNTPAGSYRLVFEANPDKNFYESNYENNISWALIDISPETRKVEVLELEPKNSPEVKHLYPNQDFEAGESDIDYGNTLENALEHWEKERE